MTARERIDLIKELVSMLNSHFTSWEEAQTIKDKIFELIKSL